ncbi:MAG: PhoH family protein, partial [Gammaproteobacteria bacterium]
MTTHTQHLTLTPDSAQRLANLCGRLNEHIHQIESMLAVKIRQRGNEFQLSGSQQAITNGSNILHSLYAATEQGNPLSPSLVHLALQEIMSATEAEQTVETTS